MKFQNREVLTGINLQVHSGEIVTLIGPNGAGKTTLVRIALGLQEPSSGQRTIRKGLRIGYMPQKLHVNAYHAPDRQPISEADWLSPDSR